MNLPATLPPYGQVLGFCWQAAWRAHQQRIARWGTVTTTCLLRDRSVSVSVHRRWKVWALAWAFLLVSTPIVCAFWLIAATLARPVGFALVSVTTFSAWVGLR